MEAVIQALTPTPTRCTSGVLAPNKSAANSAKNAPRAAGNFFTVRFGVGIAIIQSLVILSRHICGISNVLIDRPIKRYLVLKNKFH
jgi:hypothetical protein